MKNCKFCNEEVLIPGIVCRVCKDGIFRYGLNRIQQLELYEAQNKKCHLCENDIKMFDGHRGGFIDHNHETGQVRSILCNKCNTFVGRLETHQNLSKVLQYLNIEVHKTGSGSVW